MTTEQDCIEALRTAADRLYGSPTKAQYEALGMTPASATIIRTIGGWNEAKELAELEVAPSTGSRTLPKPDGVDVSVDLPWEELTVDQRWYYKNAEADTKYELERRAGLRAMIYAFKRDSDGCTRCAVQHPLCLDFHHPDPSVKELAVNKMVPKGRSREDILTEMDRCELICTNCHRREHYSPPPGADSERGSRSPGCDDLIGFVRETKNTIGLSTRQCLRLWSYEYRRERSCKKCTVSDPLCLVFHHTDESEKTAGISRMISDGYPFPELLAEVEKCEILCSNCHRREHLSVPRLVQEGSNRDK